MVVYVQQNFDKVKITNWKLRSKDLFDQKPGKVKPGFKSVTVRCPFAIVWDEISEMNNVIGIVRNKKRSKCRSFFACDGASNMLGKNANVSRLLL